MSDNEGAGRRFAVAGEQLPPYHEEVAHPGLFEEIQDGFTRGLALRFLVQGQPEPRWLVVTKAGRLAQLQCGESARLVGLYSPAGSVRGDGPEGQRRALVEYLVLHNFPPGAGAGARHYPGEQWRKQFGGPRPQVRHSYRALNPRAFGFERGDPGEPWRRPAFLGALTFA